MKKIFASDLNVLLQLYAPEDYVIQLFDPFDKFEEDVELNWFYGNADRNILVNLGDEVHEYRGKQVSEFELIFNFGSCSQSQHQYKRCFSFLKDPQGTVRWYFPTGRISTVLPFYNNSGIRGQLISIGIRIGQFLRLSNLLSTGKVEILSNTSLKIDFLNTIEKSDLYSIFTGAPSIQRSAVLALFKGNVASDFIKIPLTQTASEVILQEKRTLKKLQNQEFKTFLLPKDSSSHGLILRTENLKKVDNRKTDKVTQQHIDAILEIGQKNLSVRRMEDSPFWESVLDQLWSLNRTTNNDLKVLYENTKSLKNLLNEDELILSTASHGDFTPWNIFHSEKGLALYDWELYSDSSTPLYDLFHFIYQRGILMRQESAEEIIRSLNRDRYLCQNRLKNLHENTRDPSTILNSISWKMTHWY